MEQEQQHNLLESIQAKGHVVLSSFLSGVECQKALGIIEDFLWDTSFGRVATLDDLLL